ncbi:MAG TPA: hypothetical protein VIM76_04795, partial [Candidatus Dormibacteraeota bacterium]
MPDQRSLLLGRLATAIDGVSDVAARLDPPAAPAVAPSPPSAPSARPWTVAAAMEPVAAARADQGRKAVMRRRLDRKIGVRRLEQQLFPR